MFIADSPSLLLGKLSCIGLEECPIVICYLSNESFGYYSVDRIESFGNNLDDELNIDQLINDVDCVNAENVVLLVNKNSKFTEGNALRFEQEINQTFTDVLDICHVNWYDEKWYSMMCERGIECCNPEKPKSFVYGEGDN